MVRLFFLISPSSEVLDRWLFMLPVFLLFTISTLEAIWLLN